MEFKLSKSFEDLHCPKNKGAQKRIIEADVTFAPRFENLWLPYLYAPPSATRLILIRVSASPTPLGQRARGVSSTRSAVKRASLIDPSQCLDVVDNEDTDLNPSFDELKPELLGYRC